MFWQLVCSVLVSAAAALVLTGAVRRITQHWGLVDRPDGKRKLHGRPVSLCGGVAVWLALVLGLWTANRLFAGPTGLAELSVAVALAAGIVCLFGVADDCWNLSPRAKLLLQTAAVLPIVAFGYWFDRLVIFGIPIELGYASIPLTVLWLLACINALNLLDGMDGLAATVGLITAGMMTVIAHYMGHPHVVVISLVLAGALAGFLVHNLPPARIFLGDSGSMVIGLVVGVLGIQGAMKTSATVAVTVPAVVMSLPMLDTLLAIVRRKLTGRRLDAADREHIHHRLLDRGMSQWQVLALIGGLSLVTSGAAVVASIYRHDVLAWITVLLVVVLMVRLKLFGHHEAALLGRAVVRGLAALAARLASASLSPRPPQEESLESMGWEEAWECLTGLAERWQLVGVRLQVADEHGCRELRWEGGAAAQRKESAWSLALAFALPDCPAQTRPATATPSADDPANPTADTRSYCRLWVEGRTQPDSGRAVQIVGLIAVLQRFGRRFARCARQIPTLTAVESRQPGALPAETIAPPHPRPKAA